MESQISRITG
jgi:hypothetical protein